MTTIERLFDKLTAYTSDYATTDLAAVGRDSVRPRELLAFFSHGPVAEELGPLATRLVGYLLTLPLKHLQEQYGMEDVDAPIRFTTLPAILTDLLQHMQERDMDLESLSLKSWDDAGVKLAGIYRCLFDHVGQGWESTPGVVTFRHEPSGLNFVRHIHRHEAGLYVITPPRFFAAEFPLESFRTIVHAYMTVATQAAAEARAHKLVMNVLRTLDIGTKQ